MIDDRPTGEYWASKPAEQVVEECFGRIDSWFKWVRNYGRLQLWRNALREYYAGAYNAGEMGVTGEQEEMVTIKVNHNHSFGESIVTAVAGQPPTFSPQAANSDHDATVQTVLANGILEDAVTHKNLDDVTVVGTRFAHVLGEGYATVRWDPMRGEPVTANPDMSGVVTTGDVVYHAHPPIDVIRDYLRDTDQDHKWYILRDFECRYDVAARVMQLPEMQENPKRAETVYAAIMSAPSKVTEDLQRPRLITPRLINDFHTDEIAVYTLWHEKTPAMPQGREIRFVSHVGYWSDGPLPYRRMPIYRLSPETQMGSERGNTANFDLLPLQNAINAVYSTIVTNQSAHGTGLVWIPQGANITSEQLGQSLTILKGGTQPPQPVNLLSTPAEIPAFGKDLIAQSEILSGVNAVRRGNIDATGKLSGAAYALIDAKFLESLAGLQKSFRKWMSNIASATIEAFQDFATAEHTVRVVGKSNRAYVDRFTKDRISKIVRVDIEVGNPLQRTTSGRLQLVQMLYDMQLLKTPEQIYQVLTTGRTEPVIEGTAKELDNIKAENEQLGEGVVPVCVSIDNHPLHIEEHSSVLASPESRLDPRMVNSVLAHIQEHINLWTTTDPQILAARKISPPPSAMMPPMSPPPSGGPQGGDASAVVAPQIPGDMPNMPNMPTNPATGEPAPSPMQ